MQFIGWSKHFSRILLGFALLMPACAQNPQNASVCASVEDPAGAVLVGATLGLVATGGQWNAATNGAGQACFNRLPPGKYQVTAASRGFMPTRQQIELQAGESARLAFSLHIASATQEITVAAGGADVTSLNVAETQIGSGLIQNLPSESTNAALSSVLTLATPGVAADSNGVFHPLGEHAETSFSVDGQPISDQQSRIFSNQISANTLQDMRTLQGAPPAEFGDKTSLIIEATTRSGLNTRPARGTFSTGYGSFSTPTASFTLGAGSPTLGNFLALDALDSNRFLDAPEFHLLHASGNSENLFDRVDWHPGSATALHFNATAARSWFQVPDTYDQQSAGQDQRQRMTSFNFGLALSHVLSPTLLATANTWVRQDRVHYFPSANLFSDQPATLAQSRRLTSTGLRADATYSRGRQTAKAGAQLQVTPLSEAFDTGLTDPGFNSPCVDDTGTPVADASLTDPSQCAPAGYSGNPGFQPALLKYDLTRGGALFQFRGGATITEGSAYLQDSVRLGRFAVNPGLRYDNYHGLSTGYGLQPRIGIAWQAPSPGTIVHASYARVLLTPYNENLVLSSSTGPGGLASGSLGTASVHPLTPARRNQFNVGIEQQLGSRFSAEAEYFWKFTGGAYDFNTILNTPLDFPIQFRKSKIDGAMARITLNNVHGFSAFTVLGHVRSRLFSPEIGGINFGSQYAPVARPDHDQGFEQTTNLQYEVPRRAWRGLWLGLTWRFDSGLVVVSVPDYATALTLTGDQQQEIGLFCGDVSASVTAPLRNCSSPHYGATRIHIVPPGTYDPDRNPSRIRPRSLFDVALGSDSLWKESRYSLGGKITLVNLADKQALYNFLSSFSGTHFVTPRDVQGQITLRF